jgi:eukaryotic-like serine/threonine-protein kinase
MEQVLTDQTERTPVALSSFRLREAVERARSNGPASLTDDFVPPPGDPQRVPVLLAIMRADLSTAPTPNDDRVSEYQVAFPDLTYDSQARGLVDTIRRSVADLTPPPGHWSKPLSDRQSNPSFPPVLPFPPAPSIAVQQPVAPRAAELELTPDVAENLGFTDLAQLGKGGFGSVYLAKQPALGLRQVAIKYTALPSRESQVLAALHHPNIVPVLSVHEYQGARVFCMPFHGRHTLADVLHHIDRTKSLPATGAGFLSTIAPPPDPEPAALAVAPKPELVFAEDAEPDDQFGYYETDRQRLTRLSYVDSVVMGMTRLADALVHAHCRRVIHLDIKPANILITDDGVFMILDFGLAHHDGIGPSCQSGGTIRYMAPEQLTQFVNGGVKPDVRMDLYSLGVVFYELLTGRHPFAASMGSDVPMHQRIAARQQMPPSVRAFNPAVPLSVQAIVHHLLHPDRAKRYQSAEHLLVDLTRHQQHLPLKYAANPSVWERVVKFRRRHPVFAVALMALVLGMIALAAIGIAGKQAERAAQKLWELEFADAADRANRLIDDQVAIRIDAGAIERRASRDAAIRKVERWWDEYGVETDPTWQSRPTFARLEEDRKATVLLTLVEQGLLAAHAERMNATGQPAEVANPALDRAAKWNRRAEAVLGGQPLPPVLLEQQADLARLRGEPTPPDRSGRQAGVSNLDHYLRGLTLIAEKKYTAAITPLKTLITAEPHHAAGQFALGVVYQFTGEYTRAMAQYQVAKALAKTDPRPAYNRGALLNFHGYHAEALDDLNTAIDRDPAMVETYYQRAMVRINMSRLKKEPAPRTANLKAGLDDINQAIERGGVSYRYLSLREMIHTAAGATQDAAADLKAMATIPFRDEQDYLERANRLVRTNRTSYPVRVAVLGTPAGAIGVAMADEYQRKAWRTALLDYNETVKRNPHSSQAWQGKARTESDLRMTEEAIKTLKMVIELLPGDTSHRFNRAVLLARVGRRFEAVGQIAGVQPDQPFKWYQKACVYSLCFGLGGGANVNDRDEAFHALKTAISTGFNEYDMMRDDTDLDAIRDQPGVEELLTPPKPPAQ